MKQQPRVPKAEVARRRVHLLRGQTTLTAFTQPTPQIEEDLNPSQDPGPSTPTPTARKGKGSTRNFLKFSLDMPEMANFQRFLMSLDGKLKQPHVAKSIATDVSKFLKYAKPQAEKPDWSCTYQKQMLLDYLEAVKTIGGCSQEGQLSKLESICNAIRYVQCWLLQDDDPAHTTCLRVEKVVLAWKSSLRKQKTIRIEERKQEFHEKPSSLQEVTTFTGCQELWERYWSIVTDVRQGVKVSQVDANMCTVAISSLFLYHSCQRAGAVENCTMREYKARENVRASDGSMDTIISVKQHKTAIKGPASLVLSLFVCAVRPQAAITDFEQAQGSWAEVQYRCTLRHSRA